MAPLTTSKVSQETKESSESAQLKEAYDYYLDTYLPKKGHIRSYAGKLHTTVLQRSTEAAVSVGECMGSRGMYSKLVQAYKDGSDNFKANMERKKANEVRRVLLRHGRRRQLCATVQCRRLTHVGRHRFGIPTWTLTSPNALVEDQPWDEISEISSNLASCDLSKLATVAGL